MVAAGGEHPLIQVADFRTPEELVIYLMHRFAYEDIARRIGRVSAVLDLGCNIGYGLPVLRTAAESVVGADVSPTAVAVAERAVADSEGISVTRLQEGASLPFANDRFDAVVSCQVIEHVADVDTYLREIRRLLRPGGRAFLTTPNRLIRLDPGMAPWNPHHLREFAPDDLAAVVARVFPNVEILGLRASPAVEAVERARTTAAREQARRVSKSGPVARLKAMLPPGLRAALKRVLGREAGNGGQAAALPGFTTADFEYRAGPADEALDLMAVCRAD